MSSYDSIELHHTSHDTIKKTDKSTWNIPILIDFTSLQSFPHFLQYYLDNQRHQFEDALKSLKEEKNEFQEERIQLRNNIQELQISHAQQREELFVKISEERIEREKRFLDLRAESVEKLVELITNIFHCHFCQKN